MNISWYNLVTVEARHTKTRRNEMAQVQIDTSKLHATLDAARQHAARIGKKNLYILEIIPTSTLLSFMASQ